MPYSKINEQSIYIEGLDQLTDGDNIISLDLKSTFIFNTQWYRTFNLLDCFLS